MDNRVVEFLKEHSHIPPQENPKAIIMVGPPASGKKTVSLRRFSKSFLIVDVDDLRDPSVKPEHMDEELYRFSTQKMAERRRVEIVNRAALKKIPVLIHALSGSDYWYNEAINLRFAGYQVIFMFMFTQKDQVLKNLEKRTKEQREKQGYAITADRDFIEYSFSTIPRLAEAAVQDKMNVVSGVFLIDQEGKDLKVPREKIPEILKMEYEKPVTIPDGIRD